MSDVRVIVTAQEAAWVEHDEGFRYAPVEAKPATTLADLIAMHHGEEGADV